MAKEETKDEVIEVKTYFYKVLQAIYYQGGNFYPERSAGDKTIPADVIEMDEPTAKAFGQDYLKKVSKKDEE
jgi:hypothetical protein